MKELVPLVEALGTTEVRTYIQSGNVVFDAKAVVARRLPSRLTASIKQTFGFDVPVVVRSASEIRKVLASHPFASPKEDDASLHVAFLSGRPSKGAIATLDYKRSPGDRFVVDGAEVYLHLPKGAGKTKLSNDYLEKQLGVASTMRNWRTIATLVEML
jgi:uncharacterized protein (DUF1697 family)